MRVIQAVLQKDLLSEDIFDLGGVCNFNSNKSPDEKEGVFVKKGTVLDIAFQPGETVAIFHHTGWWRVPLHEYFDIAINIFSHKGE